METHLYIEVDNCSPKVTEKRYGYVLECAINTRMDNTRNGFGKVTGTYHQATLTAMIEALRRFRKPCEIYIHAQNTFVLRMLEENLEKWYEDDFVSSSGKPVANQDEWKEIHELVRQHLVMTEIGKHPYSNWLQMEIAKNSQKKG